MTKTQKRAERQQIAAALRQAAQPLLKPGALTKSDWKAVMTQLFECHERLLALQAR